jgi:hypothetical protein
MSRSHLYASSLRTVKSRTFARICAYAAKHSRWPRCDPTAFLPGMLANGFAAFVYRRASANGPSRSTRCEEVTCQLLHTLR